MSPVTFQPAAACNKIVQRCACGWAGSSHAKHLACQVSEHGATMRKKHLKMIGEVR